MVYNFSKMFHCKQTLVEFNFRSPGWPVYLYSQKTGSLPSNLNLKIPKLRSKHRLLGYCFYYYYYYYYYYLFIYLFCKGLVNRSKHSTSKLSCLFANFVLTVVVFVFSGDAWSAQQRYGILQCFSSCICTGCRRPRVKSPVLAQCRTGFSLD